MSYYFSDKAMMTIEGNGKTTSYAETVTGIDFTTGLKIEIKVYTDPDAKMALTFYGQAGNVITRYDGYEAEEALTYLNEEQLLSGHGQDIYAFLYANDYCLAV